MHVKTQRRATVHRGLQSEEKTGKRISTCHLIFCKKKERKKNDNDRTMSHEARQRGMERGRETQRWRSRESYGDIERQTDGE